MPKGDPDGTPDDHPSSAACGHDGPGRIQAFAPTPGTRARAAGSLEHWSGGGGAAAAAGQRQQFGRQRRRQRRRHRWRSGSGGVFREAAAVSPAGRARHSQSAQGGPHQSGGVASRCRATQPELRGPPSGGQAAFISAAGRPHSLPYPWPSDVPPARAGSVSAGRPSDVSPVPGGARRWTCFTCRGRQHAFISSADRRHSFPWPGHRTCNRLPAGPTDGRASPAGAGDWHSFPLRAGSIHFRWWDCRTCSRRPLGPADGRASPAYAVAHHQALPGRAARAPLLPRSWGLIGDAAGKRGHRDAGALERWNTGWG